MRRTRTTINGFTVVELLVVVAVIGIISASLIALSVRSYRDAQLRDGAVQLMTELRQARAAAQRSNQSSTVTLTSTSSTVPKGTYTVQVASATAASTRSLPANIQAAPYKPASASQYPNSAVYTAPYAEMGGAGAVTGVIWEVSSTQSSRRWYIKTVGVTGKVMLSAQAN